MSRRKKRAKPMPPRDRVRQICLGALVALLVATPLVLSEGAGQFGTHVPLTVLYLLLAIVWLSAGLLRKSTDFRSDWVLWSLAGLVIWQGVSTLVMSAYGAPRPALNIFWLWVAYGVCFLLVRQLVRTTLESRATCAAMIAVAVCLSSQAYAQYFVQMPRERAAYAQDPEGTLRELGIYSPPGSVTRELFEQRLASTEPTATFALTNSLAGFLAPWFVLLLAIVAGRGGPPAEARRFYVGAVGILVLIAGCLLLTKSRTALVATVLGAAVLAGTRVAGKWRFGWKKIALAAITLACLVAAGIWAGALDLQIVTEASKSLRYRFQYWDATWGMIADHPWFGCGPGNFQSYYTAYMLPETSEQVADPHNFLLEVWATAGTPALLLLVAALVLFTLRVVAGRRKLESESSHSGVATSATQRDATPDELSYPTVYLGALAGLLLAYPIGLMVGMMPDPVVLTLGLPAAAAAIWFLHPWVAGGTLSATSLAVAAGVLLVNLLAAGGIGFPGVAVSLWLLMALGVNLSRPSDQPRATSTWWAVAATALMLLLLAACYVTAYAPVLKGRVLLEEGEALVYASRRTSDATRAKRLEREALACFEQAAAADPFASDPPLNAARMHHQQRLRLEDELPGSTADQAFHQAAGEAVRLDPRSQATAVEIGFMQLEAYDASGDRSYLARAREAMQRGVKLFPVNNFAHARLAWLYYLEGNPTAARQAAAIALELDRKTPHQERKLRQRGLFDDLAPPAQIAELRSLLPDKSAEQLMLQLRNGSKTAVP